MENTPQYIPQKRPRGRPKTIQIPKSDYMKQYSKDYRHQISNEKGEKLQNYKNSVKKHVNLCKKSFSLIKEFNADPDLPEKFKTKIILLLNSENLSLKN